MRRQCIRGTQLLFSYSVLSSRTATRYGSARFKQLFVRELPKKRRRTEVSASSNWQPGAVGRHKITLK